MIVGVLQVELIIHAAQSLKDKRRVVRSVKDRLHREHLVAVAEVDELDTHQRAVLGIAAVSRSTAHANSVLSKIVEQLRNHREAVLGDHQIELLNGH